MLAKFSKQWALWAKRVVWLMLGLLLVGGLMRWAFRPNPVEVELSEAVLQPFSAWIEEEGRTRVRERFVVSAPAVGRLRRMPWKEGQMVRRGEILAILDAPSPALLDARKNQEHTAQLAAAQARKDMAESQLAVAIMQRLQAQDSFNRQADLHAQGFVSDAKIQADHYALQSSMANFDAAIHSQRQAMAEVALVQAGALMNGPLAQPLFIRSPMDGQILRVVQASETSVQAGTVLLEIADLDDMQVVVPFLSADMAQVQVGQEVEMFYAQLSMPLMGYVARIEPAAFTKISALGVEEQRVNVWVKMASAPMQGKPAQTWGEGWALTARLMIERQARVLQVPNTAVFPWPQQPNPRNGETQAQNMAVFVVQGDRAVMRRVVLRRRGADSAWISQGLQAGEWVINYPSSSVQDGTRVVAVSR